MATNLTDSTIASTYGQLLHVDGGPEATEKTVYSGTGTPTALKLGTASASVDNVKIDGNVISTTNTNGNLYLTPNGTGSVYLSKVTFTGPIGPLDDVVQMTINALSVEPALRITQLGVGDALLVEDSGHPDSTPFLINNLGTVVVGHTSSLEVGAGVTPMLQLHTLSNYYAFGMSIWSNQVYATSLRMAHSRGLTPGSHVIVNNGDLLGTLSFAGSDGVDFQMAGFITCIVDGTPGVGDMPGRLAFFTCPDGAALPLERMRLTASGRMGVGELTPASMAHISGGLHAGVFDLLGGVANGSIGVGAQDAAPQSVEFSASGLSMYMIGQTHDKIQQYTLGTAWDVTTATFTAASAATSAQDGAPTEIRFNPTGTKVYILGGTNSAIYQYTLATPWDVTTLSYDSVSLSLSGQDTGQTAMDFSVDGTKVFVAGITNDTVYEYTLPTPWVLTSGAYSGRSYNVLTEEGNTNSIKFTPDGSRMFVMGIGGDDVNVYALSTRWDITTAVYVNKLDVSIGNTELNPRGLALSAKLDRFYVIGSQLDTVVQYDVTKSAHYITGDVNVYGDTFKHNGTQLSDLYEAKDATILKDADVGTNVQAYSAALGRIYGGTGTPESVVTAPVGSLYLRTDGGANTTLYVKESGVSNTGWIAK